MTFNDEIVASAFRLRPETLRRGMGEMVGAPNFRAIFDRHAPMVTARPDAPTPRVSPTGCRRGIAPTLRNAPRNPLRSPCQRKPRSTEGKHNGSV